MDLTTLRKPPTMFTGRSGQMAELLLSQDSHCCPVGSTSSWLHVLQAMVSTVRRSPLPIVIHWGPAMIALYNDAFIPLLGPLHPQAYGRAALDCPGAWQIMAPHLEQARRGHTVQLPHQRHMLRRNGFTQEHHFTFSHSPIVAGDGGIGGVLTVATETTVATGPACGASPAHEAVADARARAQDAEITAAHLRRGLDTSRVIGTAIGIIMVTCHLNADQAFRLFAAASQNTTTKLRDLAATVTHIGALPYRRTTIDDLLIRTLSAPQTAPRSSVKPSSPVDTGQEDPRPALVA